MKASIAKTRNEEAMVLWIPEDWGSFYGPGLLRQNLGTHKDAALANGQDLREVQKM